VSHPPKLFDALNHGLVSNLHDKQLSTIVMDIKMVLQLHLKSVEGNRLTSTMRTNFGKTGWRASGNTTASGQYEGGATGPNTFEEPCEDMWVGIQGTSQVPPSSTVSSWISSGSLKSPLFWLKWTSRY
jgi:hypothetical protein